MLYGVREFSADPDDVLRITIQRARHDVTLPDGMRIAAGDRIVDLHIWNERVLRMGWVDGNLGWASRIRRSIDHSLNNLAACVEADPSLQSCKALRAEAVFAAGRGAATAPGIAGRYGLRTVKAGATAPLGNALLGVGLARRGSHVHPARAVRGAKPWIERCGKPFASRCAGSIEAGG